MTILGAIKIGGKIKTCLPWWNHPAHVMTRARQQGVAHPSIIDSDRVQLNTIATVCVVDEYSQAESQFFLQRAAQQNSRWQRLSYPQCFQPCSKHRPRCPRCECQCRRSPSCKIHVCKTARGRYHHRTPPNSSRTASALCPGVVWPSVQWRRHMRKAWTHRRWWMYSYPCACTSYLESSQCHLVARPTVQQIVAIGHGEHDGAVRGSPRGESAPTEFVYWLQQRRQLDPAKRD